MSGLGRRDPGSARGWGRRVGWRERLVSRAGALAVPLLLAAACQGGADRPEGSEDSDFQQLDSAGVTISVSDGEAARSRTYAVIDTLPDLQIGERFGDPPYEFSRLGTIRTGAANSIWVLNFATRQLRRFSSSGEFELALGGPGEGPGEFTSPTFFPGPTGDTLLVLDRAGRRTTLVGGDGAVLGTSPAVQGALTQRFTPFAVGSVGARMLIRGEWISRGTGGLNPEPDRVLFLVLRLGEGTADTIADWPSQWRLWAGPAAVPRPFDERPSAAVGRDSFFLTRGEGPEILEYGWSGDLRRIIRLDEPPRRPTASDVEALIDYRCAREPPDFDCHSILTSTYEDIPLPEEIPAFEDLRVDGAGRLWAALYEPIKIPLSPPSTWLVFEGGRACGTVEAPPDLEIHAIEDGFVLGRWRDELEVEYIRRHPILPVGEPGPCSG